LLPKWNSYMGVYNVKCLEMKMLMIWSNELFSSIFNLISPTLSFYDDDRSAHWWLIPKWTNYKGIYIGECLDVTMFMKVLNELFSSTFNFISPTLSFSGDDRSVQWWMLPKWTNYIHVYIIESLDNTFDGIFKSNKYSNHSLNCFLSY
jgi:hypothetical protein